MTVDSVALAAATPRASIKLTDVAPTGRSTLICAGLVSTLGAGAEGVLAPTTYEVPAGHRLRLAVAGGDFPRIWPSDTGPGDLPSVVGLTLPVALADTGKAVHLPEPAPEDVEAAACVLSELELTTDVVSKISNDTLENQVSVRISDEISAKPPSRSHRLHLIRDVVATAPRLEPSESSVAASARANVETEAGEEITVEIEFTATPSTIVGTGEVRCDGSVIHHQRWLIDGSEPASGSAVNVGDFERLAGKRYGGTKTRTDSDHHGGPRNEASRGRPDYA